MKQSEHVRQIRCTISWHACKFKCFVNPDKVTKQHLVELANDKIKKTVEVYSWISRLDPHCICCSSSHKLGL